MDKAQDKKFKIINKHGRYSKGIVTEGYDIVKERYAYSVAWDTRGKTWASEKNLKTHLLKCAKFSIPISDWTIVEVVELPTKPVEEWFDQKMLVALLKTNQGGIK